MSVQLFVGAQRVSRLVVGQSAVDWAQIKLASGSSFTCMFGSWLDNDTGYSNDMTVGCTEGRIFHLAFVIN